MAVKCAGVIETSTVYNNSNNKFLLTEPVCVVHIMYKLRAVTGIIVPTGCWKLLQTLQQTSCQDNWANLGKSSHSKHGGNV